MSRLGDQQDKFTRAERRWQEWQPRSYALADRFIPKMVDDAARKDTDRIAFVFGEEQVTFAALQEGMKHAAAGFQAMGVGAGDRVALMLPNSRAFLECWFGLNLIGAISVPVNTAQIGTGLAHQIGHARCSAIVIDRAFLAQLHDIAERLPELRHTIVHGGAAPPEGIGETLPYNQFMNLSRKISAITLSHRAISTISYTSGTTGLAKGVMIRHNYWYEIFASTIRFARLVDIDRHYCALPFFHMAAHGITGPTLLSGASAIISRRFSASRFMQDIRAHGCTTAKYVGSIIPFLMKQPESPDDGDNPLRLMIGSAAPANLFAPFQARYNTRLLELYGMSECNACLVNPLDDRRPGSCGKPSDGWDVRLVDEHDRPVQPGMTGEIVARPLRPWLGTAGYDGDPEATLELTRNFWIHTGDLARQDEDGYFYFVDRKKQSIRRRGENISSFEIEAAVNSHEAVLESAAVGVPSPHGEDEIKLVVRLREGHSLDARHLLEWCRTRLPKFALPRYIAFRQELPKTASHRIEKLRLKSEGITHDCVDLEQDYHHSEAVSSYSNSVLDSDAPTASNRA